MASVAVFLKNRAGEYIKKGPHRMRAEFQTISGVEETENTISHRNKIEYGRRSILFITICYKNLLNTFVYPITSCDTFSVRGNGRVIYSFVVRFRQKKTRDLLVAG